MTVNKNIFIFGMGYTAQALIKLLVSLDWQVTGTTRIVVQKTARLPQITYIDYSNQNKAKSHLEKATHLLISIPPMAEIGDLVLSDYSNCVLEICSNLKWIGYLSTTGVYGDYQGNWVDETDPTKPNSSRAIARMNAESQWLKLEHVSGIPVQIFRLAGIYGVGRNAFEQLKKGNYQCVYKPNHYFSRIHVEDIAQVLLASMNAPQGGQIYNVSDDMPAPNHEVMAFAAHLLGMETLETVPYECAILSDMAKDFYTHSRRVCNDKIKKKLGIELKYPSYREGLSALLKTIR